MKKFSFVSVSGKVVTVEGIALVKTAKLDAIAGAAWEIQSAWGHASLLQLERSDYVPTLAVYKRLDNN